MNKHFEFVPEDTIEIDGHKLTRIRALVDLPLHCVFAGDLGGYIEKYENLHDQAWVANNAAVYGNASISGKAYVSDNSRVWGNARVFNNACVFENAQVFDNACISSDACVYGNSRVCNNALVCEASRVYDNATVLDNAWVYGISHVSGDSRVSGNACISGTALLSGNAQVSGNACISGNARLSYSCVVKSNADFITVGPAISSNRYTTAYRTADQSIYVATGCFTGDLDDFEQAINKTHAENAVYKQQYLKFVQMIKLNFDV